MRTFSILLAIILVVITPWWIYFGFGALVGFVFSPIIYLIYWKELQSKMDEDYKEFCKFLADEGEEDALASMQLDPERFRRNTQWQMLLAFYFLNGLIFTVMWPVFGTGCPERDEIL